VVIAAANVATLTTFDLRHDRFDLGTLANCVAIESNLHWSAVMTGSGLRRGTPMLGWNYRTKVVLVAGKRVIALRIITGIRENGRDPNSG